MILIPILKLSDSDIQRFWSFVSKGEPDECWPWTGFIDDGGYGQLKLGPAAVGKWKNIGAHRIAKYIESGPPEEGQWTLHHCDNPPCCNERHLYYGVPVDNTADCIRRGRRAVTRVTGDQNGARLFPERVSAGLIAAWKEHPELMARGEGSTKHKLTADEVREIRALYATGTATYRKLSEQFGVQNCALHKIIHRESWRHIA